MNEACSLLTSYRAPSALSFGRSAWENPASTNESPMLSTAVFDGMGGGAAGGDGAGSALATAVGSAVGCGATVTAGAALVTGADEAGGGGSAG